MGDYQLKAQLRFIRGSLSQADAAKRAGISQQMWSKLETGNADPDDSVSLYKIARAFDHVVMKQSADPTEEESGYMLVPRDSPPAFLRAQEEPTRKYPVPDPTASGRPDEVVIPQLSLAGSMGGGIEAPDHVGIVNLVRVNLPQLRREVSFSAPTNLRIVTGYGDSMEPTFRDGDPLIVDTGITDITIDGVYVLERETGSDRPELFIKRVQRHPIDNTFIVSSDNKNYQPIVVSESDRRTRFKVSGRVLLAWNSRKL